MTKAAHLTRLAWIAAVSMLSGCAGGPAAQAQTVPARRSNVVPPSIEMAARQVDVAPSARIVLTAQPHGGEAMLFSIDWSVAEGPAGGSIQSARRNADGSYEVAYTAPSTPGTYHVTATIREFPAAVAATEVRVGKR